MNQKGFINIAVVVIVLVAVAISGYFVFAQKCDGPVSTKPQNQVLEPNPHLIQINNETYVCYTYFEFFHMAVTSYFFASTNSTNVSVSQTTQPEITGWKTYTNNQYGFEFQLPLNAIVNSSELRVNQGQSASINVFDVNATPTKQIFNVKVVPTNSDIKTYAGRIYQMNINNESISSDLKEVTINGQKAYSFLIAARYRDDSGYIMLEYDLWNVTFLSDGKQNLEIWLPTYNLVSDQILSTFKFTK